MQCTLEHVLNEVKKKFAETLLDAVRGGDELTLMFPVTHIIEALTFLRDHHGMEFRQLTDLCAVDYLGKSPRFELVYHLLSYKNNLRIRVKVKVEADTPVPTASNIFSAANWYEREVYDLFGIGFLGHPDLRRLLTDYNFDGHPLRKDFP